MTFTNAHKDRSAANQKLYNVLRNKVNQMCVDAKDSFLKHKLNVNAGMKTLWKNAKALGLATSISYSPAPSFTAHEFNVYTSGVMADGSAALPYPSLSVPPLSTRVTQNSSCFAFRRVSDGEVHRALMSIKSNAVGLDDIPLPFIKLVIGSILPQISHIVNFSITSSTFADVWKISKVYPEHKKTRFFNMEDYRAIHILPVLSKLFEILLAEQISEFIALRQLRTPFQSSLCNGHSTTTALFKIMYDIQLNAEKSKAIVIGAGDASDIPTIKMYGVEISYSKSVKNLGLVINSRANWNDHVSLSYTIVRQSLLVSLKSTLKPP